MGRRVGFVGLGNIGAPMAQHLLGDGLELVVYDVRPEATAPLAEGGAEVAPSCRDLGARCEVIGVCVRDDADVEAVVCGEAGLLADAKPGTVVAIHSTIHPRTVHRLAAAAARQGVRVLDAPITGGRAGAVQRNLCVMVGGDADALERCRSVFERFASRVVHAGPQGTGAAVKLCNNLMTYLGFLAASEATLLSRAAGLTDDALDAVTRANGVMTDQMRAFLGVKRVPEDQRRSESFQDLLLGFTTLAEKDLALALEFARELGITLPGTGLCQQQMARVYGLEDPQRR